MESVTLIDELLFSGKTENVSGKSDPSKVWSNLKGLAHNACSDWLLSGQDFLVTQLKRARVTSHDLVAFYCACVRSSLDYACAVFHFSLPQYLQTELERIQKRALFTIYPGLSYAEALVEAGIESIQDHQRQLSINLFCAISENPDNKLNKLVPPIITSNYNLRKTRKFRVPVANTKRFAESFIMKGAQLA